MIYVFENLDEQLSSKMKYITCTRLPNWNYTDKLKINDVGFLQCEFVTAGADYYKVHSKTTEAYQYSNCYFNNFIKQKEEINEKEFKF